MEIRLTREAVDAWDLSALGGFVAWSPNAHYFSRGAGMDHYRLIGLLAGAVDAPPVYDVGTFHGCSAAALASSGKRVVTYDVRDWIPEGASGSINEHAGIERRIGDCVRDAAEIARSDLVVLDVDPHDGSQERRILGALSDAGFRGLVLLDDIHLNAAMEDLWASIRLPKVDATAVGHASGTGIVMFDPDRIRVVVTGGDGARPTPGRRPG